MQTVKVESPISDDNPTGHVVINVSDFNPEMHRPFSEEDFEILRGTPLENLNPSIVAGAGAQLDQRHAELEAEADRQRLREDELTAKEQRLAELEEELDRKAAAAAVPPATAPAAAAAEGAAAADDSAGKPGKSKK